MFEVGIVVSVVIALGQMAKQVIPGRYVPLVTLVFGIAGGIFYMPHSSIQEAIFNGVVVALSANGLFDMSKLLHQNQNP